MNLAEAKISTIIAEQMIIHRRIRRRRDARVIKKMHAMAMVPRIYIIADCRNSLA